MANNSVTFKINLNIDGKDRVVLATTSVDNLRSVIDSTKDATQRLNEAFVNATQKAQLWENLSSGIQALSGTLSQLTAESRGFGGAMAAVNTMAGKSGAEFAALKEQVADLSKQIPIARDELANGLYQVISNGVPENNWIAFLEQSAKASVGGIADLGETVKVTSTLIKNYGLEWDAAGAIQDKIQLTAKNGVTTFEELAQALPRVTANAATLGVSVDDLMASFATLTGVSGNTAEVSTQLAAIFTALIKPSSEATEMAQQMGIEFNAASIKAAGGLTKFLAQLDSQVKSFAKSSGMLEQEIYGKLFGSAESLRAITPLTGNLAEKFEQNAQQMQNSAGTIEGAFSTMASTAGAKLQMMNNQMGEFTDSLQSYVGSFLPYLNMGSQLTITISAIMSMKTSIQSLWNSIVTATGAAKLWRATVVSVNAITQVCSATMRGAAVSATTLKMAIRGLLVATGVGVAIAALSTVMEHLMSVEDDTSEHTDTLKEAEQAYQTTAAQTKVSIDSEIKKLQNLIKAKGDTTKAVKTLNSQYGEVFGNHKTAAEWYDVLTKKSQIYARQLGYEAQMKVLSTKLAEKQIQLQDNYDKRKDLWKQGGARQTSTRMIGTSSNGTVMTSTYEEDTQAYTDLKNEGRQLLSEIGPLQKQLAIAQQKMAECSKEIRGIGSASTSTNKSIKVSEMNLSQLEKAIEQTENKLKNTTNKSEISTLKSYEQKLQAQKKALEAETGIGSYTKTAKAKKEPKFYKNPITSEQLDKNINYYSGKLTSKNTAEDQKIRKQIQLWKEKKAAIDLANLAAERPAKLNSTSAYEKDISTLRQMVSLTVDPDAAKKLQQQLEAEQRELGMLRIKIGIDEIPKIEVKKTTKGLFQKLDEDIANWVKTHKPIEIKAKMKGEGFDKVMGDIKDGWGSIQGVGDGIQGITDALKGSKNAWQAVTGIINGFISVAEGIKGIVSLIDLLTASTNATTAATAASTTATTANTAASVANTTAKTGEAIAGATASGAKLPFPANIAAIAAGVAAVVAALGMISGAFAEGGVVGGNSPTGDKLLVRVNSGEMILNAAQQARLFALANGTAVQNSLSPISASFDRGLSLPSVTVQSSRLQGMMANGSDTRKLAIDLKLRGRDLVAAIANETRTNSRRSNIKS